MKNTKLLIFLGCIAFLMGMTSLQAQDTSNTIGNVNIASPTAASLGKYGDVPVSYNTGIPNISVPIYTVQSGSLKIPISLSYHAGGLKVQENASWVGAGWSLNAGGAITRTVQGAPDDRGIGGFNVCTDGYYSDYGFNSYLFITGQTDGYGINGVTPDDGSFQRGVKDGQPDLFFFNFGGYTGKFYFNDDRTPIMVPEQDFKIQPDLLTGANNYGFQGFVVTTPDGTKYYFGKTGNDNTPVPPVEITTVETLQSGYNGANQAVSSWFLNKIISADGMDSITLNYQAEQYSYYALSLTPTNNLDAIGHPIATSQTTYGVIKNFINGVRLSQINFPNGSVAFNHAASLRTDLSAWYTVNSGLYDAANTQAYALGSITVNNNNGFCKKDSFYFGYFHDPNPLTVNSSTYGSFNINSDSYRLRLDSVKETACDGSITVPPYKFAYYSELVPRKLSFGADHWGFSNGVTANQSMVPSYSLVTATGSIVQSFQGANRDAMWPAMRGGALQQITYPTGGYTSLVYQPNDTYVTYTNYVNTPRTSMSCGYDGHNGSLGDGGDNPDTTSITVSANTYMFVLSNSSGGGSGELEIYNSGTNTLAYNVGGATAGQTDTFYLVMTPGRYWMELTKSPATSGNGITATISENVPVSYSGNDTVGGLRIQTITNNDGLTPIVNTTSYTYTNGAGTQSSGILYSRPVYVQTIRNDVYGFVYRPVTGCSAGCASPCNGGAYFISPSSLVTMSTVQGNHIGYNEVKVSQSGNGYSIYQYYGSTIWDNQITDVCTRTINTSTCTTTIPNYPSPPEPFEPMRGELKYEGHYNNSGQVLKEKYYFPQYVWDSLATPGIIYLSTSQAINFFSYTSYFLQSASKVKDSTISVDYDPVNANHIQNTGIAYCNSLYHHQPVRKVTFTSTGDSLATNIKYAMDFRIASCDAVPDSLPYYLSTVHSDTLHLDSMISTCVSGSGQWLCRLDTFVNYRYNMAQARIKFDNYRRRSFANDTSNLVSRCYLAALSTADTLLKPILRLQNMYDNSAIENNQWRDLKLLHANFTRYDTSLSPVGFAYPGRTKLIDLQAPSTTFTPAVVSGTTIAKDSRYMDETIYNFSNGNPVQVLPRSGDTIAYIWDYLNTEPIAKATNSSQSNIAYTSFEADGKGNWAFSGTPVSDASSPTGSKCYGLSSGSISKTGLSSSATYVVSYWSKTGSSYTVTGSSSVKQGKTINGWTYFEHTAMGNSTITVSGSGSIDELRLYPSTSLMTTYTYTPLLGMTSQCDADNRITYYFYDGLGRLKWIKDQDLNIIKTIQYHYLGLATQY